VGKGRHPLERGTQRGAGLVGSGEGGPKNNYGMLNSRRKNGNSKMSGKTVSKSLTTQRVMGKKKRRGGNRR